MEGTPSCLPTIEPKLAEVARETSPAPFHIASAPSKLSRGLGALALAVRHPATALRELKGAALNVYREGHYRTSRLPVKDLFQLIDARAEVRLSNFDSRAGNVACQLWSGVYGYLNELAASHPLVHIRGTTLAYWCASGG